MSSEPETTAPGGEAAPGGIEEKDHQMREPAAVSTRPTFTCDLCGHLMLDLHCKLVCERCGYKRDCSDP